MASLRSTVLIQGESGTGKEMVARAIHNSGDRAAKPFVAVSCAALAETLLESELFGHEKGAFTGADQQKRGKFETGRRRHDLPGRNRRHLAQAAGGPAARAAGAHAFTAWADPRKCSVDVRVIAATHVNLQQAVAEGKFRDDLYYRLNVIEIRIPPLRDRREDIPLLARHFLERLSHELGKDIARYFRRRARSC